MYVSFALQFQNSFQQAKCKQNFNSNMLIHHLKSAFQMHFIVLNIWSNET